MAIKTSTEKTLTILSGQSATEGFNIGDLQDSGRGSIFGVWMPTTWTAANISLEYSRDDGVTWVPVTKDGAQITYPAAASEYVEFEARDNLTARYVRLVSGTSLVPVAQSGDRELNVEYGRI